MLTGFVLMGGVIGVLILTGVVMAVKGINWPDAQAYITGLAKDPASYSDGWYELIGLQAVNHLSMFLLPALLYWSVIERRSWSQFSARPLDAVAGLSIAAFVVVAFMPFDGLVIEWNQNMHLPQMLAPLEEWMRDMEDRATGVTKFLTTFNTPVRLMLAILVIGVIPAIGEEVLFRGILQRNLIIWTRNPHVGVWLAAALFSAIHVQFLGFVPRMLLGALFGYLYLWSGNIWVPILAHFVNNGFTVLMVYLYQRRVTTVDIESTESVPILVAVVSLVLTGAMLAYFRKQNTNKVAG